MESGAIVGAKVAQSFEGYENPDGDDVLTACEISLETAHMVKTVGGKKVADAHEKYE